MLAWIKHWTGGVTVPSFRINKGDGIMGRGGKAGRIFSATIEKLRAQYKRTWGKSWPHDDSYLTSIWHRAVEAHPPKKSGYHQARYAMAVLVMRENHQF